MLPILVSMKLYCQIPIIQTGNFSNTFFFVAGIGSTGWIWATSTSPVARWVEYIQFLKFTISAATAILPSHLSVITGHKPPHGDYQLRLLHILRTSVTCSLRAGHNAWWTRQFTTLPTWKRAVLARPRDYMRPLIMSYVMQCHFYPRVYAYL